MTLNIAKYLKNLILKEAKISHFTVKVDAGKIDQLHLDKKQAIQKEYGDSYLQDSDYLIFFTKDDGWKSGDNKKLFDLVNRGLGEDANGMTQNDFKQYVSDNSSDGSSDDTDDNDTDEENDNINTLNNTLFLKITIK